MRSIISRSLLLPVLAAAIVLGFSTCAHCQSSCLTFASTNTIIHYSVVDNAEYDFTIGITNTSSSPLVLTVPVVPLSGDSGILILPSWDGDQSVTLLPGQTWDLRIGIYFQCPPIRDVYTTTIAIPSESGAPCSIDTITVYIEFPITDSITVSVPPGANTITIAPDMARSRQIVSLQNTSSNSIFLDSISIANASNIAYFGQPSVKTLVYNDSLFAGQTNDFAILTLIPTDTGVQNVELRLFYNDTVQTFTIQDDVSHNSLNQSLLSSRSTTIINIYPQQKRDTSLFVINTSPDTITVIKFIIFGDSEPGVPWSIDTNSGLPLRLPVILPPAQHFAIEISAVDSGCDPITGTLGMVYSYRCGTDTLMYALSGRLSPGTICTPAACISTVPSLDFGQFAAGDSVTQVLTLTNQTNDTVGVGLVLRGNDANRFSNPTQVRNPVIIPAHGSVDISFTFTMPSGSSQKNYSAELIGLELSSNPYFVCDTLIVPFSASLLIPAGVSNTATPPSVDFSLIPNPASGEVTVLLPENENATVEIYDVLGNVVLQKVMSGQFVWSGETSEGKVPYGIYFVRVSERTLNGVEIVSTQRLVFQ